MKTHIPTCPSQCERLYEGKAKVLYATNEPDTLWVEYKNHTTAFDGEKDANIEGKGQLNNLITTHVFTLLETQGIRTHLIKRVGPTSQIVRRMKMFPLEIVVRNTAAGHFCTRLGVKEGELLKEPVLEFYLKNDELHDPFVNDDDLIALGVCTRKDLNEIASLARHVNKTLTKLFADIDIRLVDFKIEAGRASDGSLLLGDEITPDSCRLWNLRRNAVGEAASDEVQHLDKDLFRRDLGDIIPAYEEVEHRLAQLITKRKLQ